MKRLLHLVEDSEEGFTLIELLVVIIIIGILAAIALPVYLNQKQKAYDTSAKSALRTLAQSEEAYIVGIGSYGTVTELVADGASLAPSKGVTIKVEYYKNGTAYCLSSQHASSPTKWWFDSQSGGIQTSGATSCPVTNSSTTPGGAAGGSLTG